ncbi:hypothetical protein BSKO_03351 [Bryopsis sp. KO-2023]|nr:hypothetical protein BSKO_03351 [Bryopsis sp. KO-2023]
MHGRTSHCRHGAPNQLSPFRERVFVGGKLLGARRDHGGELRRGVLARAIEPGQVAPATRLDLRSTLDKYESELKPPWTIRLATRREAKDIADVMAKVFHKPQQLKMMNDASFTIFKAEVLNSMISKLFHIPEDRFACMVICDGNGELCAAVEVSRQDQATVLQSLARMGFVVPTYAYISGMAVLDDCRRQGFGTALLSAAEYVADVWGESQTVLHVYVDNPSAIEFYEKNGYSEIHKDDWFHVLGRRKRLLMRRE